MRAVRRCCPPRDLIRLSHLLRGEDWGEGFIAHTLQSSNPHPSLSLPKGEAEEDNKFTGTIRKITVDVKPFNLSGQDKKKIGDEGDVEQIAED